MRPLSERSQSVTSVSWRQIHYDKTTFCSTGIANADIKALAGFPKLEIRAVGLDDVFQLPIGRWAFADEKTARDR